MFAGWGLAVSFSAILFAWSFDPQPIPAQTVAAPPPTAGVALRTEGLSRKQVRERLRSLKDTDIVEIAGRRVTKGQLKIDAQARHQRILAKAKADTVRPSANLSELQAKFAADQQKALDATNANARAEFARLAPPVKGDGLRDAAATERDALRREAVEMLHRAANASPAELEAIESRAQELLPKARQLKRAP